MKHLLSFFSLAILCLLTSCLTKSSDPKVLLLDIPASAIQESFVLQKVEMPEYLCAGSLRYTTEDGELKTVPGGFWALPLDKLIRDSIRSALRHTERNPFPVTYVLQLDQIIQSSSEKLLFKGAFVAKNDRVDKQIPFAVEVPFRVNPEEDDDENAPERFRQAVNTALTKILKSSNL